MNNDEIQKFLDTKAEDAKGKHLRIEFKKRDTIYGSLVVMKDFKELKAKNLWRIVREKDLEEWKKSKNLDLAKIFSGSDFAKLSVVK